MTDPNYNAIPQTTSFSDLINPDRPLWYILILTVILGALQMAWTVEFSECTPFLLSNLGLSKSVLALVWIAGPLSGTIGQPIVGILSDNCNLKYGRRRPFILGGALVICLVLLMLSHSVDIVSIFVVGGVEKIKHKTVPLAILGIYVLDFSISAYQAASRAFIVDMVPSHQQQLSNAWAARMIGLFNMLGYYLGSLNLSSSVEDESSQFKAMTVLAVVILMSFVILGCTMIKERDPNTDALIIADRKKNVKRLREMGISSDNPGVSTVIYSMYRQTLSSVSRLSPQVKLVNMTEFLAWVGYFPMLFYTTTYVGELYIYETISKMDPSSLPLTEAQKTSLVQQSTRVGSHALFVHSMSSLLINVFLPYVTIKTEKYGALASPTRFKLPVKTTWTLAHFVFAVCAFSTFFITTSRQATVMLAFLGIPWGSALWAPFVLIAEEITRIKEKKLEYSELRALEEEHGPRDESRKKIQSYRKYMDYEHESGIILGIHNVFVSAPQVVSSLFSSILFNFLSSQKGDKFDGVYDTSLGWVFRFGGLMTIGALIMSMRVKTNEELQEEDSLDV